MSAPPIVDDLHPVKYGALVFPTEQGAKMIIGALNQRPLEPYTIKRRHSAHKWENGWVVLIKTWRSKGHDPKERFLDRSHPFVRGRLLAAASGDW